MIVSHLFARDPATGLYLDAVEPDAAWVLDGEGVATRMRDGVTMRVKDDRLWRAWVLTHAVPVPEDFEPGDGDEGYHYGWVPISPTTAADALWRRAPWPTEDGTYELCGHDIGGNREGIAGYAFFRHGSEILPEAPRAFDALRVYLAGQRIEGIVWHHPDGWMVKVARRAFGLPWPPEPRWRGQPRA